MNDECIAGTEDLRSNGRENVQSNQLEGRYIMTGILKESVATKRKCSLKRIACFGIISGTIIAIGIAIYIVFTNNDNQQPDKYDGNNNGTGGNNNGTKTSAYLILIGNNEPVSIYLIDNGRITWSHEGKPCPINGEFGRAVVESNIYIIAGLYRRPGAGETDFQPGSKVAKYSIHTDKWQLLPIMPGHALSGPVVFFNGGTLYSAYDNIYSLPLSNISAGWAKEDVTLPHSVTDGRSVTAIDDRVFVFGIGNELASSVISWRPASENSWTPVADMRVSRAPKMFCTVTDGHESIWVIGGCFNCWPFGFMEQYQLSTRMWKKLSTVPDLPFENKDYEAINAQICEYWDGHIFALFSDGSVYDKFFIYNIKEDSWEQSENELNKVPHDPISAVIAH